MNIINFDKPDENIVDFFAEVRVPEDARRWEAPSRVESAGVLGEASPKNVAEKPDTSRSPEDSKDLVPEQRIFNTVDSYLKEGRDFGIAADFDENIARSGTIDPEIRQAFIDMIVNGTEVVIISSRGAKDIAQRVDIPGVSIVGTLGWETLDKNGQSRINEKFKPFQSQITGILRDVRERFLTEQLNRSTEVADEPNIELETPDGKSINLQRKGYNEEYPEGINSTWALSLLSHEAQDKYKEALKGYYQEAFDKYAASMTEKDKITLKALCGFQLREGKTSDGLQTLDVEIRPTSQITKSKAMIQLMRDTGDPKRQRNFEGMPYHPAWIYSGDHVEQDGRPMRAGHTADFLSGGKRKMLGIWTKPLHEEEKAVSGVDVIVNGVAGNAKIIIEIARRIEQQSPA